MRRSPEETRPEFRQLRIYAIDPMVSRSGEHQVTVQIRYEELRGPVGSALPCLLGRRVEVVDCDTSQDPPLWLAPVDLDAVHVAMQLGLEPAEADPQFHQQMVYAVAMRTLEQFDRALGRVVYFRGQRRLRLVPHAFRGANAFYHPKLRAVLFGYFRASVDAPGQNLPGQTIFTCLSHDIIAHEVTHAIVDRLRPHFNVATNPHVRAFHEAFADLIAIFQRLTYRDLVQRALQDARGDLRGRTLLSEIAAQFGEGLGGGGALRTVLDSETKITDVAEEHDLGLILVAALFDGFRRTYERRTADLLRIATGGSGVLPEGALHPDLVGRLTQECVRTAQSVLTMCIRALDYLPPADVTFGAFLRALVTADWELNPLDDGGLRAAIIEACRLRGIFAEDAGSLAVSALLLDAPPRESWHAHVAAFRGWIDLALQIGVEQQRRELGETDELEAGVDFPESLEAVSIDALERARPVSSGVESSASVSEGEVDAAAKLEREIMAWLGRLAPDEKRALGLHPGAAVRGFHPSHRIAADGTLRFGLVVQLVSIVPIDVGGSTERLPQGVTLVFDVNGALRYVVRSRDLADGAQRGALEGMAQRARTHALGWRLDGVGSSPFAVDYHGLHEERRG